MPTAHRKYMIVSTKIVIYIKHHILIFKRDTNFVCRTDFSESQSFSFVLECFIPSSWRKYIYECTFSEGPCTNIYSSICVLDYCCISQLQVPRTDFGHINMANLCTDVHKLASACLSGKYYCIHYRIINKHCMHSG